MWGGDKQVVSDMCRLIVEWEKKRQGVVKKAKRQVVAWEGFIL
jgi:predicted nucleic acid-binding Zn ribbon protein